MEKIGRLFGMSLLILVVFIGTANSSPFILDTGAPTDATTGLTLYKGNGGYQDLAAQFDLGSPYEIQSIQVYVSVAAAQNSFDVSIYDENFNPMGFSDSITIHHNGKVKRASGWFGLDNLNWILDKGTYWVVFDNANQGLGEKAIYFPLDVPFPTKYAKRDDFKPVWDSSTIGQDLSFGVRINGEKVPAASNPIPSSLILFGTGMAGMATILRRKKR